MSILLEQDSIVVGKGLYKLTDTSKILFQEPRVQKIKETFNGQTIGYKNDVYITSNGGQSNVLCTQTGKDLIGTFDIKKKLPTSFYVNHQKNLVYGLQDHGGFKVSGQNYEKVGNLKVKDGILSDVHSGAYLVSSIHNYFTREHTLEFKSKFKLNSPKVGHLYTFSYGHDLPWEKQKYFRIYFHEHSLRPGLYMGGDRWKYNQPVKRLELNTTYYIKITWNGYSLTVYCGEDKDNLPRLVNITGINDMDYKDFVLGGLYGENMDGEIDLNETTITLDDKLEWVANGGQTLTVGQGYYYRSENYGYVRMTHDVKKTLDELVPKMADRKKVMSLYVSDVLGDNKFILSANTPPYPWYGKIGEITLNDRLDRIV